MLHNPNQPAPHSLCEIREGIGLCDQCGKPKWPQEYVGYGNMVCLDCLALDLRYFCDRSRHLVCQPYNKALLHEMARRLGIKRCWFHRDHYDIPKTRIPEITAKCTVVTTRRIIDIIGRPTMKQLKQQLSKQHAG